MINMSREDSGIYGGQIHPRDFNECRYQARSISTKLKYDAKFNLELDNF